MCYTLLASPFLLPGEDTKRHSDLLFVAKVRPDSPVANKTVLEAGLRSLERLFLVAVERQVSQLSQTILLRFRMWVLHLSQGTIGGSIKIGAFLVAVEASGRLLISNLTGFKV